MNPVLASLHILTSTKRMFPATPALGDEQQPWPGQQRPLPRRVPDHRRPFANIMSRTCRLCRAAPQSCLRGFSWAVVLNLAQVKFSSQHSHWLCHFFQLTHSVADVLADTLVLKSSGVCRRCPLEGKREKDRANLRLSWGGGCTMLDVASASTNPGMKDLSLDFSSSAEIS